MSTKSLRDPEIAREKGDHGLLVGVAVHDSVIARIVAGTDHYPPAALPADFNVVSTARGGQAHAAAVALWKRNNDQPGKSAQRFEHQENCWDFAWKRRLVYFATIAVTLALLSLPHHGLFGFIDSYCSDDRCFAQQALDRIGFLFPDQLRSLLKRYTATPVALILFALLIWLLIATGKRLERRFRDCVRGSWTTFLRGQWPGPVKPTFIRHLREHGLYQWSLFLVKWRLAPLVFGLIILLLLATGIAVTATQTFYALAEPHAVYCKSSDEPVEFDARQACTDLRTKVEGGVASDGCRTSPPTRSPALTSS